MTLKGDTKQMTSDRVMKALSIILLIMAAIGLVMSVPLIWQIDRADNSEEGRAFLEELRQQMATELDLPLEEPPEPTPSPVPEEGTESTEGTEAVPPAGDALEATPEPIQGVRTEDVINYFMYITTMSIIDAVLQLFVGLVGLLRWNKPDRQGLPIAMGIIMLVWMIVRVVLMGISADTIMSHLMNVLLPVAFIWASVSNRKPSKPSKPRLR